jgi:hypothetical protein
MTAFDESFRQVIYHPFRTCIPRRGQRDPREYKLGNTQWLHYISSVAEGRMESKSASHDKAMKYRRKDQSPSGKNPEANQSPEADAF